MFEVGIWKYEVVAKGEVDVLKFEVGIRKEEVVRFAQFSMCDVRSALVPLFCRICNPTALNISICNAK